MDINLNLVRLFLLESRKEKKNGDSMGLCVSKEVESKLELNRLNILTALDELRKEEQLVLEKSRHERQNAAIVKRRNPRDEQKALRLLAKSKQYQRQANTYRNMITTIENHSNSLVHQKMLKSVATILGDEANIAGLNKNMQSIEKKLDNVADFKDRLADVDGAVTDIFQSPAYELTSDEEMELKRELDTLMIPDNDDYSDVDEFVPSTIYSRVPDANGLGDEDGKDQDDVDATHSFVRSDEMGQAQHGSKFSRSMKKKKRIKENDREQLLA